MQIPGQQHLDYEGAPGFIWALSLSQPYANKVCEGIKTLETRTYGTGHRGDLLICAAKSGDGEPKGVALCVVRIAGVRLMTEEDEEQACIALYPKAKAWELEDRRVLQHPFPVRGMPGLFKVAIPEGGFDFVGDATQAIATYGASD